MDGFCYYEETFTMTILCLIQETPAMIHALEYAERLARLEDQDLGLLYTLETGGFNHWYAVQDLMREEQKHEALDALQKWSHHAKDHMGRDPILYIKDGPPLKALQAILDAEHKVTHLVLSLDPSVVDSRDLLQSLIQNIKQHPAIPFTVIPAPHG
jgi:hypothetical protein